jgi:hypothetical protein
MFKRIPEQWSEYRRRNWIALAYLIFGLPFNFAIAAIIYNFINSPIVIVLAFLLWIFLLGWFALKITRFPCPRCNVPFIANQNVSFVKKRCCNNCGLGLYEKP